MGLKRREFFKAYEDKAEAYRKSKQSQKFKMPVEERTRLSELRRKRYAEDKNKM